MLLPSGFEIILVSPPAYERLVAEIYFDGKFVALVNQERGIGHFDLETPGLDLVESAVTRVVELPAFLKAIEAAMERLRGRSDS